MLILGFDTATPVTAIGISRDGEVLASRSFLSDKTQTEQLMPAVDCILKETGLKIRDVEGLAVGLGPGLFTSTRIGVMTAKSLAYALKVPLVGICTLDTTARGASHLADSIVAVIDARRQEIFVSIYEKRCHSEAKPRNPEVLTFELKRIKEPSVIAPGNLKELLQDVRKPAVLAGNGTIAYREKIEAVLPEGCEIAPEETVFPDARHLLALAGSRIEAGATDDADRIVPIYIRHVDAKTYTGKGGS